MWLARYGWSSYYSLVYRVYDCGDFKPEGGTSEAAVVIRPEHQKILRIASGQSGDIHLQPSAF
jgi:hypothetical protein